VKVTVSFLDDLEKQIRDNKAPNLAKLVDSIKSKDVPRSLLARYANLIRRMGGTLHALKLLNPVIRNRTSQPSVPEIIEYASCLTRLQLSKESIELLSQVKDKSNPEVFYEIAVAHLSTWDYHLAIPFFKSYLEAKDLNPYKRVVGELNLGASYIYVHELANAEKTLESVRASARQQGFKLLEGSASELLVEVAVTKKDFAQAKTRLAEAKKLLGNAIPRYLQNVEKWQVIMKIFKEKGSKKSLEEFAELRKKVAALHRWNILIDIELFKAIAINDKEKIHDLYYGIPYSEFRKRISVLWGNPIDSLEFFERKMGPGSPGENDLFDVTTGRDFSSNAKLKVGQNLHRLLSALASDFYLPFSSTKLFSLVFAESKFNPDSSPNQVYEVVRMLNAWFEENKIPLKVIRGEGGYRLRAQRAYVLRIPGIMGAVSKIDEFLLQLRGAGLIKNFSVKMVEDRLKIPRRSATRLLTEAVELNKLVKQGQMKGTKYSFG
jgi:hypothetical protein